MRHEPDGSIVPHVDLSHLADDWNELVVDGRGNVYINGRVDFDFSKPPSGIIALIKPDGSVAQVADGIAFPNGMVVTPDNRTLIIAESVAAKVTAFDIDADGSLSNRRTWADGFGADGICLDAYGAIWGLSPAGAGPATTCYRVGDGGELLEGVELDRNVFSCILGGPDGRTLFMLAAEWRGFEEIEQAIADRTGQVCVAAAPSPHAGWP